MKKKNRCKGWGIINLRIYINNNFLLVSVIFFIEDLGSTNGTFVNGTKIDGRVKLSVNDEVRLGNIVFKVID